MEPKNVSRHCERSEAIQIKKTSFLRKFGGFTLVELIVVITILTILGTIGFMQVGSFQSSARDSVRTSNLANLSKGLELFMIKTGSYPAPVGAMSYTGEGNGTTLVQQGGINGTLIGFSVATPLDPLTKTGYVYSIWGNGIYYQIAGELENPLSFSPSSFGRELAWGLVDRAYADSKTALVKGNYIMDPSLPSLIVVPGSVPTSSGSGGIFSPDVCFVTNGSSNTVSIGSGSCVAKKNMALKSLDSNLVGYWDMETCSWGCTISWSRLKDLSWNWNDGSIVWNSMIQTWWIINKGIYFDGGTSSYIEINKSTGSILNNEEISLSTVFNMTLTGSSWWFVIWDTVVCGANRCANIQIGTTTNAYSPPLILFSSYNNSMVNSLWGVASTSDFFDKRFVYVVFTRKNGKAKAYVNWTKIAESTYDVNTYYPNSNPFRIGVSKLSPASVKALGIIDDIKIYNRTLSDSEIKQQAKIAGF